MWVNIDFSLSIGEIISYLKTLDSSTPIYISFNTLCKGIDILNIIPEFLHKLKENGLNVQLGPHFVEEGCIIDDKVEIFDELYFKTSGEKIIWYTLHFPLPEYINTIVLLSENLGIEPIIIHMKDKTKKFQYLFAQKDEIGEDLRNIIAKRNWKLVRIKNGSGGLVENNN